METTTITTGTETILTGQMNIAYEVVLERKNNQATLYLYAVTKNGKAIIDSAVGTYWSEENDNETFEQSLERALQRAKLNWQLEVPLKEVA